VGSGKRVSVAVNNNTATNKERLAIVSLFRNWEGLYGYEDVGDVKHLYREVGVKPFRLCPDKA
jgi:hypothetical protein